LPDFVKAEFDAYLACGRLDHGFVRLRCAACGHSEVLAFGCKRPDGTSVATRAKMLLRILVISSCRRFRPSTQRAVAGHRSASRRRWGVRRWRTLEPMASGAAVPSAGSSRRQGASFDHRGDLNTVPAASVDRAAASA
jgi:hypothetical protein